MISMKAPSGPCDFKRRAENQFHFNFVTQTYMFKMFIIVTTGTEVEWAPSGGRKNEKRLIKSRERGKEAKKIHG